GIGQILFQRVDECVRADEVALRLAQFLLGLPCFDGPLLRQLLIVKPEENDAAKGAAKHVEHRKREQRGDSMTNAHGGVSSMVEAKSSTDLGTAGGARRRSSVARHSIGKRDRLIKVCARQFVAQPTWRQQKGSPRPGIGGELRDAGALRHVLM